MSADSDSDTPERTKIGVRVRQDVWEEFREYVKSNRGQIREALGNEVEDALMRHMQEEEWDEFEEKLEEIENSQEETLRILEQLTRNQH